ncbi:hypothetical protein L2E82_50399 [Cichorium intybus]|nr:hypothetical protein L2E82_50399 [Cichorium intybus]
MAPCMRLSTSDIERFCPKFGKEDMIKRRFYKQEHGDKGVPSDSSSSSESELDAEAEAEEEEEEEEEDNDNIVVESRNKDHHSSSSSDSEDGSANEVSLDSSGLLAKDDVINLPLSSENHSDMADKYIITSDLLDCVLKSRSVFKYKLCPRIVFWMLMVMNICTRNGLTIVDSSAILAEITIVTAPKYDQSQPESQSQNVRMPSVDLRNTWEVLPKEYTEEYEQCMESMLANEKGINVYLNSLFE